MKSRFESRLCLVAIGFALFPNVDVEARALKSTRRVRDTKRGGQLETLDGASLSVPASLTATLDRRDVEDSSASTRRPTGMAMIGRTGSSQPGYDVESRANAAAPDDIDQQAAQEEEEDDKLLQEEEKNDTKAEKEQPQAIATQESEPPTGGAPEGATTTPPSSPYAYMYQEADAVARDAELRRGMEFHPQGTVPQIDVSKQDQFKIDSFFNQDPSIFGNCVLIRDFAEPLRVGSALIHAQSSLRGHPRQPKATAKADAKGAWHANSSRAAQHGAADRFVHFSANGKFRDDGQGKPKDSKKLPDDVLLLKGGVIDRDSTEQEGEKAEDDVELEVSMFAFLRTVAGEVAVIPNGGVAKWSSKKKVPIAGYLCTSDMGPVLHTLPTPCLPTSLDENGQPFAPPVKPPPMPVAAKVPPGIQTPVASRPAPAQAPAAADPDDALEAEAEAEAKDAEAVANGPGKPSMLQTAGAPAPAPAAGPAPALETSVFQPAYSPYHVWVGSTLLEFRSKPKAERFCKRLTKRIAEDIGDEEWDADRLMAENIDKKDLSVSNFMALSRKRTPSWTTGTKKVLVVLMDWLSGDSSRAPYSKQTQSPAHYKDKIFPRVRQAFQRMSYGKFDISVTVVPEVVRFSKPRSRYTAGGYPFPGLYNGAKESLEGSWKFGDKYSFSDYDLVYVITPQQAPTGTKGVAWVGAKGALCNGCEEISENFQVMVAVHELGHNLGLWHASSKSLEYGNVFDWMGNYPDVTGLSYGLGYKLGLHWLPQASISKISDADLGSLNNEYLLMPFDSDAAPAQGQLTGVQINLKGNRRDLYIAYRKEPAGGHAGVFLTMQDRDKPNSELIDCACHSPSQQDAALKQGWTYIDPSGQVVIHAYKIEADVAKVRIFKAPGSAGVAGIKARSGFTDGQWKCPRVCTDSDLLVSQYKGCSALARDGYCNGGSIRMSGKKFTIGTDLCPKSCDKCDAASSGGTLAGEGSGCADKNVKISGMTCGGCAAKGYCDYSTNIGHIGDDLCQKSCGRCPAKPAAPSSNAKGFTDPTPARTYGRQILKEEGQQPLIPSESEDARNEEAKANEDAEEAEADKAEKGEESAAEGTCTDDAVWSDADGDGCAVYANYVKQGKLTVDQACNYGDGQSKSHCRKTCNTCQAQALASTCEDKQCVTRWRYERGKCFACDEWKHFCSEDFFAHDCPRTCGMCKADGIETTPPLPSAPVPVTTTLAPTMPPTEAPTPAPPCKDEQCVQSWLKSFGVCHKCADFAEDYCGRDELFMKSCRKSCRMCDAEGPPACHDDFLPHTCKRYAGWGWCATAHIAGHCKASCGICGAELSPQKENPKMSDGMPKIFNGSAVRHSSWALWATLVTLLSLSATATPCI